MADGNDLALGYAMGQDSNGGGCNNGFGMDGGWWAIILFAMIFGWGNGGWGGFGGGGGAQQGYATQADIQRGFDTSNIIGKLDGVSQGLCDGFYSQNTNLLTGLNGVNTTLMQGFHGVDNAVCNLGYQTQAGFNSLSNQLASCCCETQRAIDGVNYNMATNTCAIQTSMANNTRDIIDSQNAGVRAILDKMCQQELDALRSENQNLKLAASQANQNATIGAMISASEATILRRTGAECPTAAYVVQPPTPVNFPTNGCGQFAGWGNNGWGGNGCNQGCGSCC